jgi:hypothetical protein
MNTEEEQDRGQDRLGTFPATGPFTWPSYGSVLFLNKNGVHGPKVLGLRHRCAAPPTHKGICWCLEKVDLVASLLNGTAEPQLSWSMCTWDTVYCGSRRTTSVVRAESAGPHC